MDYCILLCLLFLVKRQLLNGLKLKRADTGFSQSISVFQLVYVKNDVLYSLAAPCVDAMQLAVRCLND